MLKKFNPKVAVEWKGKPIEVPLVLNKAFMTRNPMLPAEELARKHRDPLIVKLNSNVDHSLFENKGKYTLIVASFYGQSMVKPAKFEQFDRMLSNKSKISLDNAARESWELMTTMRNQGIEAFVYHERFRSIVTVGAFKGLVASCEVKSYNLSGFKTKALSPTLMLVTYKATAEGTCDNQKIPSPVYSSSIWERQGADWIGVFHQESMAAPPPKPAPAKKS